MCFIPRASPRETNASTRRMPSRSGFDRQWARNTIPSSEKIVVPRSLLTVVDTLKNQGVSKSNANATRGNRNCNKRQKLKVIPRITHTRNSCNACILPPPKNRNIGENNMEK